MKKKRRRKKKATTVPLDQFGLDLVGSQKSSVPNGGDLSWLSSLGGKKTRRTRKRSKKPKKRSSKNRKRSTSISTKKKSFKGRKRSQSMVCNRRRFAPPSLLAGKTTKDDLSSYSQTKKEKSNLSSDDEDFRWNMDEESDPVESLRRELAAKKSRNKKKKKKKKKSRRRKKKAKTYHEITDTSFMDLSKDEDDLDLKIAQINATEDEISQSLEAVLQRSNHILSVDEDLDVDETLGEIMGTDIGVYIDNERQEMHLEQLEKQRAMEKISREYGIDLSMSNEEKLQEAVADEEDDDLFDDDMMMLKVDEGLAMDDDDDLMVLNNAKPFEDSLDDPPVTVDEEDGMMFVKPFEDSVDEPSLNEDDGMMNIQFVESQEILDDFSPDEESAQIVEEETTLKPHFDEDDDYKDSNEIEEEIIHEKPVFDSVEEEAVVVVVDGGDLGNLHFASIDDDDLPEDKEFDIDMMMEEEEEENSLEDDDDIVNLETPVHSKGTEEFDFAQEQQPSKNFIEFEQQIESHEDHDKGGNEIEEEFNFNSEEFEVDEEDKSIEDEFLNEDFDSRSPFITKTVSTTNINAEDIENEIQDELDFGEAKEEEDVSRELSFDEDFENDFEDFEEDFETIQQPVGSEEKEQQHVIKEAWTEPQKQPKQQQQRQPATSSFEEDVVVRKPPQQKQRSGKVDAQIQTEEGEKTTFHPSGERLFERSYNSYISLPQSAVQSPEQLLETLVGPTYVQKQTNHHSTLLLQNMIFNRQLEIMRHKVFQTNLRLLESMQRSVGISEKKPLIERDVLRRKLSSLVQQQLM